MSMSRSSLHCSPLDSTFSGGTPDPSTRASPGSSLLERTQRQSRSRPRPRLPSGTRAILGGSRCRCGSRRSSRWPRPAPWRRWSRSPPSAFGGALMGLAGWLFTITINYIEPSGSFAPAITFSVWVMVIVGGAGNLRGAIVGAFAIYGLEWLSVQLKDYAPRELKDTIFYIRLMIVGTLLIVLIIYRPEGILREKKRILR